MEYRNAEYNENGSIDVDVNHPVHGWIPFTASIEDVSEFGRLVHGKVKGGAKAYAPKPTPPHIPQPSPDLNAAIRALIAGDTTLAQTAMDRMK